MKNTFTYLTAIALAAVFMFLLPYLSSKDLLAGSGNFRAKKIIAEDTGKQPFVLDIEKATIANKNYRDVRWTGAHLQMVLMSVNQVRKLTWKCTRM